MKKEFKEKINFSVRGHAKKSLYHNCWIKNRPKAHRPQADVPKIQILGLFKWSGDPLFKWASVRLLFFFLLLPVFPDYPRIQQLNLGDPLFRQLQDDIENYYKSVYSREEAALPSLNVFRYNLQPGDDLLGLAARFNLPYETIATLNRLEVPENLAGKNQILVPNLPGIFLCTQPATDLEEIMTACREYSENPAVRVTIVNSGQKTGFLFFAGDKFHPVERAFFLKILFRFPLARQGRLSSGFGARKNPFTGHPEHHNGIDIAAPVGTGVLAARDGKVEETGYSPVYGYFIVLSHVGNYQTVYGHLSRIYVNSGQEVDSGAVIAETGNTGKSTGPHLHFEVIKNGDPRDPLSLFR